MNSWRFPRRAVRSSRWVWPSSRRKRGRRPPSTSREHDRAPLLLVAGDRDNIMPESMVYENFARYRRSPAPTDFKVFHHRPHLITAIEGWEEVADYALTWTARHTR